MIMMRVYTDQQWTRIVKDYLEKKKSLMEINKKYGISIAAAGEGLKKRGVKMRTPGEAALTDQWRKVMHITGAKTRLITIPIEILRNHGFKETDKIVGKWDECDGRPPTDKPFPDQLLMLVLKKAKARK